MKHKPIIPRSKLEQPDYSVSIGILEKEGWTYELKDFEMSDEELLGL